MARSHMSGAEHNTTTDGIDDIISDGATIVTSPVNGSRYAWELTSASGGAAVASYARFGHVNTTAAEVYYKFDFQVDTTGAFWLCQFAFGTIKRGGIRFTGGTLQLATAISSGVGSTSVTVTTGVWHTCQASYDAASGFAEFYLDGVFVDSEDLGAAGLNCDNLYIGQFQPINSVMNVDNIIVNDGLGADQNTYPDINERVVLLHPNATMTEAATVGGAGAVYFRTSGGGAGSGTTSNWNTTEELAPDGDTSYVRKNANESNRDWYVIENIADVGFPAANDTVTAIGVGCYAGGNGTTDRFFRLLYETAAGGTGLVRTADINSNVNAYFMYGIGGIAGCSPLIGYPDALGSTLDAYQIGWEADDANARQIKGSTFWLEVSYIPEVVATGKRLLAILGVGK